MKKTSNLIVLAFCLLTGILGIIFLRWVGVPFSSFEAMVVTMVITGVSFLFQIAINTSEIAKSLEKNAETKSSEDSDEQGKK